jgi:hypothetical protein
LFFYSEKEKLSSNSCKLENPRETKGKSTTMSGGGKVRRIRRGDIVWAKPITHKNNWSPAIVTFSNDLAISISFFDNVKSLASNKKWFEDMFISGGNFNLISRFCRVELDQTPPPPRTFFLESELLPFDQPPFPFINDAFQSAVRLFGQRIISSLQCRCIKGYHEEKKILNGSGYGFDPTRVLGFVLDAAVLPWVEVEASCVVDAVKFVAQVHAFRQYSSIQQKKVYKETRKLGIFLIFFLRLSFELGNTNISDQSINLHY